MTKKRAKEPMKGAPANVVEAFNRLKPKQKAFALALPLATSQKAAMLEAGYSESTARSLAFQTAKHPDVQTVVAWLSDGGANGGTPPAAEQAVSALAPAKDSIERHVEELCRISLLDPRTLYDEHGCLLPVQDWPDEAARAISSIESYEEYEGRGEDRVAVGIVRKVKFHPKIEGINTLSRIKGWFRPQQHEHDVSDPLKALLNQVSGTSLPVVPDPPAK